jgi:hypothetical protein
VRRVDPDEDAITRGFTPLLPVRESEADGVDVPIPTFPFWRIVKSDVPVEDATLNGSVPALPCTLNVYEEDVALIPNTVPLSIRVEVPSVVGVSHLVA